MRERGQSAVVGFILMFALVILLLTILQVSAVPSWNQGEEFEHSQRVQNDLELLRDDVRTAATTGRVTSESVRLGLRYPRRPFLLNPTDPAGTIETTPPGTVAVTNLTASGEAGDYWTSDTRTFETRHVVYRPNYNEYDNAPTTVLENSVLYDRYGNRTVTATAEQLVNGRRITLVTLNGSISRTSAGTTDIAVEPVSAPEQVTSVEGDGPVRLELPTRLDESAWRDLLEDELVANGGHVHDNITVSEGDPHDTVTITLQRNQSYDLRMARVRLGSASAATDAHYITAESATTVTPAPGSSRQLVFEVRDRYNNPVSGVTVDAAVDGDAGTVTAVDATTDADGHAVFRYTATASGTATVNGTFGDAPGELETASIAVDSTAATGATAGADGTGPEVTGIDTNATTASGQSVTDGTVLNLTATASDFQRGGTDIYAVEWWSNRTNPGGEAGVGFAFDATDGAYDTVDERVTATVDTSGWDAGGHTVSVRAQDANGNWGPVETYDITIPAEPADTPPTVSIDGIDDNSLCRGNNCNGQDRAEFSVDWSATDDSGLSSVTIALEDSTGTVVDSVSPSVSGPSAAGTGVTLEDTGGYDGDYTIVVRATDDDGQSATASQSDVADGN